ncbi:GntP family permease, partial [Phreatobacter sp. HK31-P]
ALPLASVLALNVAFAFWLIPMLDASYLAMPKYGSTDIAAVRGLWSIIAALVLSCLVLVVLHRQSLGETLGETLDAGAVDSLKPIFNTASLVGFGAVIASLEAFSWVRDGVLAMGGGNPLISLALGTSLLAGLTGSASGGMSIALASLGDTYREMGLAAGVSPDLMHRVTSLATGSLDALPHNGAVVTLLTICGLTHREAYGDIAVVAVLIPAIALVAVIALGTLFGSF